MALQNRVLPTSEIIRDGDYRGLFMGNRGCLHDDNRNLVRQISSYKRWICCLTKYKGRKRTLMSPGNYTELFFLDEATALAAGHRPCFECRRSDARKFKFCWLEGNPHFGLTSMSSIDRLDSVLHSERLENSQKKTYRAAVAGLPDGTIVEFNDAIYLVHLGKLLRWTVTGYLNDFQPVPSGDVLVLTPRSIVEAMRAGYRPQLHPTVGA